MSRVGRRMRMRQTSSAIALSAGLMLAPALVRADNQLVIVAGLGGDQRFVDEFFDNATALYDAATAAGVPKDNIVLLTEDAERDPRIAARSTKENVLDALAKTIARSEEGDDLWVVLIGHGSYRDGRSQVNLPGPDLSDLDFANALSKVKDRRVVFIDTTSGSGGFVETLSGPDRIVVTGTKSPAQRNETLFGGFFTKAFSDLASDADQDGRVSVIEAFDYAGRAVAEYYDSRHLLRTEHALLDDNGDGSGSTEPDALGGEDGTADGLLASRVMLGGAERPAVPAGMEGDLKERDRLARQLEALRRQKGVLSEQAYQQQLQQLLIDIARIDARIRAAGGETEQEPAPLPEASTGPDSDAAAESDPGAATGDDAPAPPPAEEDADAPR